MDGIGRRMLRRYVPTLAALVAGAGFVVALPSHPDPRPVYAAGAVPGAVGPSGAVGSGSGAGGTVATGRDVTGVTGSSGAGAPGVTATGDTDGPTPGSRPDTCFRKTVGGHDDCPPYWPGGDNGGATYNGVTADQINIVVYNPKRNAQVQAILAQTGTATDAEIASQVEAYEKYFNAAYQLYGRKLKITFQVGPGTGSDSSQMQADAQMVAKEQHAFGVSSTATSGIFHVELARLGVPSVTALNQYAASGYDQYAPYFYGILPDLDLTFDHVAEYWCKRLDGRDVQFDGDPTLSGPRKLGIVYPAVLNDGGPMLKKKIEACGGSVAKVVEYNPDISKLAQEATNVIVQLKQAGVTTVTCICDPVSPIFITTQATNQAYFPEWLHNGFYGTDSIGAGRLYDQQQWRHSFGPSTLPYPSPVAGGEPYRAYFWAKPNGSKHEASRAGLLFGMLQTLVLGIENAGPNLNPQTLNAGIFNATYDLNPIKPAQRVSFGPSGPSQWTALDDDVEIWWDADSDGPDGEKGRIFYVDGGQRHLLGEWPTSTPNVLSDDHSQQPQPDPDYE